MRENKKLLHSLNGDGGVIEGTDALLQHATSYYKSLFGPAPSNLFTISSNLWQDKENISEEDNVLLTKPFILEEIKHALFSMDSNRGPSPGNIAIEFYQHCWDFVKLGIFRIFVQFHEGSLDVHRFNYGVITLLPEMSDANRTEQYRPICLLRCT